VALTAARVWLAPGAIARPGLVMISARLRKGGPPVWTIQTRSALKVPPFSTGLLKPI
jgi:hypothetical protein